MVGWIFCFLILVTSCGGGVPSKIEIDQGLITDTSQDLFDITFEEFYPDDGVLGEDQIFDGTFEDASGCNQQGCPWTQCKDNSDCISGWCVETPEGKQCTKTCSESSKCPQGWECVKVSSVPDVVYACVHPAPRVCRPCKEDKECASEFMDTVMICANIQNYFYCLKGCKQDQECGEGMTCKEVGETRGKMCVPSSGSCECNEWKVGIQGRCLLANEFGVCEGHFECSETGQSICSGKQPNIEICNGVDDDCDGQTDEGLIESEECDLTNQYGTCKGKRICLAGQEVCQGSYPSPEVCNGIDDNCNGVTDEGFSDQDQDGIADCEDTDIDGDGVENQKDNCPDTPNFDQGDNDKDGKGDACDQDDDDDGISDLKDNCPLVANIDQKDTDMDGWGDKCDDDIDGDGIGNANDNCPNIPNIDQKDSDKNGIGDACDIDLDGDGVSNTTDNCISVSNPDQSDIDGDGKGDACDLDMDNDEINNDMDNCPKIPNKSQSDIDEDKIGDECDPDRDGDGILNEVDNCPNTPNPGQEDNNGNGQGDICEDDWDGDGINNGDDNCPNDYNPKQNDLDNDGIGDQCDMDIDGDGLPNAKDNCPETINPSQDDMDKDNIGDPCDKDIDGDGDYNDSDCAPTDATVSHGSKEVCNGKDDNCDGQIDEMGSMDCITYYLDADKDGFGVALSSKCLCAPQPPYSATNTKDCNDSNPEVNPNATEICNSLDDNCNGVVDETDANGCEDYYYDGDGDGWGLSANKKCLCNPTGKYSASKGGDCDDNDKGTYPGGAEVCNSKDDDCNGVVDDEQAGGCKTYFEDFDQDGYGGKNTKCLCLPVPPFNATLGGDCNDEDKTINPGAKETCNDKDDNCDGVVDEEGAKGCEIYYVDADGDSYGISQSKCLCSPIGIYKATKTGDCKDDAKDVNPGAMESCNGIDDDCDAMVDEEGAIGCSALYYDSDGDGFGVSGQSKCLCAPFGKYRADEGGDCVDSDKSINPSAMEICNSKDDNCNGEIDEENAFGCKQYLLDSDGDGYGNSLEAKCLCAPSGNYKTQKGGDCNDSESAINPGAIEICGNSKDDDCDNQIDEAGCQGCKVYFYDGDGDGFGVLGQSQCLNNPTPPYTAEKAQDCNDNDPSVNPDMKEICQNMKDDNCNGMVDEENAEGCNTYYFDGDNDGWGKEGDTKCLCAPVGKYTASKGNDCNDGDQNVHPGSYEICQNGKDDDCDQTQDEEGAQGCKVLFYDGDGDGWGITNNTKCLCAPFEKYTALQGNDCDDSDAEVSPAKEERCDTPKDDNCNGKVNEEGSVGCKAWFVDEDKDGFGIGSGKCLCVPTAPYTSSVGTDCDDANPSINPQAKEQCGNGKDDDCDNMIDEEGGIGCKTYFYDGDKDGYGITNDARCLCSSIGNYQAQKGGDCNDNDTAINPGASEMCGNNKDDDCDSLTDEEGGLNCKNYYYDGDADGFGTSVQKCLCNPSPPYNATVSGDCDDTSKQTNPLANEICDGKDNDCDGLVDELWKMEIIATDCRWITIKNTGTTTLSQFTATIDGTSVGITGNALEPGQSGVFRLAYVLNGTQTIKVASGTCPTAPSAQITVSKSCKVRLGFANYGDHGGDHLAIIRSINDVGGAFTAITGLGVETVTDPGSAFGCNDLNYQQHFINVENEDISNYDFIYYHAHSPFDISVTALGKLYDWVQKGGFLLFDDCGGANYANLSTYFGVYVDFTGNTGGPNTPCTSNFSSDIWEGPFNGGLAWFCKTPGWDWGGQKSATGGIQTIVVRGASPLLSGKKIGNGWLAFIGGDFGCNLNCGCSMGDTDAHKVLMNIAWIASGRGKLIK